MGEVYSQEMWEDSGGGGGGRKVFGVAFLLKSGTGFVLVWEIRISGVCRRAEYRLGRCWELRLEGLCEGFGLTFGN